jgi:WhiB family redox-sensing transcriptional regulator
MTAIGAGFLDWPIPAWYDDALCAQTDAECFFPEKGSSSAVAKATCSLCPVRAECLDYALDNGERYGIWGGVAERDRRKLIRLREAS